MMPIMRKPLPTPEPPQLGERGGLAYALFLPEGPPSAGIVICHGAGSAKESHFDFGRAARGAGMAAVAFDARGHGRSNGDFGPSAFADALEMADLIREHTPHVAIRGSSMGGFVALHAAAAARPPLAAVVAICPAPEDLLLRGVRSGRLTDFRMDRDQLEPWLETLDIRHAVASLAGTTAVLFMHARGDEQVPYTISEQLFEAAGDPKRLLIVPRGHHRSLQHDGEMQAESLRFIARAVRDGVNDGQ
jgi:alpha-beta hydrolase superfamily lysophospholipase